MVEKFTIADGRAAEGRGKPMIERVEWADRKITGYAEEKKETTLGRNGHFGHERTVDRVSSRGGKGTKEIGPPSSIPSLRSCQSCPTRRVTRRKRQKGTENFFAPF